MAIDLTGDFDVVAEFSVLAVDRVLAAMHQCERFPHSLAIAVNDNPPPGPHLHQPSIVASVDVFGDPPANHRHIAPPELLLGRPTAAGTVVSMLDPVVNAGLLNVNGSVVPSHLQGRAQIQLGPPTLDVTGSSGANVTVTLPLMVRYLPDPHTSPLTEFARGDLQITAPVSQVAVQKVNLVTTHLSEAVRGGARITGPVSVAVPVNVIDVAINADEVAINFNQKWPTTPLSAADLAAVNLLIRNALRTGFLPSSAPLPASINYMRFKSLLGTPNAVAVCLNMARVDPATGNLLPAGNPGNPASVGGVFLGAGDHFAFALGVDYLRALFTKTLDITVPPIPVHHWLWGDTTYHVALNSVSLDVTSAHIVVTITGRATNSKWRFPDFNFTAQLFFTLKPTGTTADLSAGNVSVDTDSTLVNGFAKDNIRNAIRNARNAALSAQDQDGLDAYDRINRMLSTDENLGQFLKSLLKPPSQQPGPALPELKPVLAYTSVEYRASGIILHGGWLTVPDPPPPHVEFEQIPSTSSGPHGVVSGGALGGGPDYSALKSWIPGGTIQQYEWSMQGQAQPFLIDPNRFVLLHPPPAISDGFLSTAIAGGGISPGVASTGTISTGVVAGFIPMCLTVTGVRFSSSGSVVELPISARACGYTRVSVVSGLEVPVSGAMPMVALTQPGPHGQVEVVGHTAARINGAGGDTPNRLVHFADEKTAAQLDFLMEALRRSERTDAPTAVVAVLTPRLLASSRHVDSVIYAEDEGGAWTRALGVKTTRRPLTLILGPRGGVVWQDEGDIDRERLAAALRTHLARGGFVRPGLLAMNLRIGRPAPNFVFEMAPGRRLTLRKLARRPVVVGFWKSSKPCIEALREADRQGAVVLAINDGEPADVARRVAAESGLSAIIVPDPQRQISLVYGVNVWPTIVDIDALGLVRDIRYARHEHRPPDVPQPESPRPENQRVR